MGLFVFTETQIGEPPDRCSTVGKLGSVLERQLQLLDRIVVAALVHQDHPDKCAYTWVAPARAPVQRRNCAMLLVKPALAPPVRVRGPLRAREETPDSNRWRGEGPVRRRSSRARIAPLYARAMRRPRPDQVRAPAPCRRRGRACGNVSRGATAPKTPRSGTRLRDPDIREGETADRRSHRLLEIRKCVSQAIPHSPRFRWKRPLAIELVRLGISAVWRRSDGGGEPAN